jgi:hypothetical protein
MKYGDESIGGLAISSSDWKKIHELESRVWARFEEAKANVGDIKTSISDDVSRLVKVGGGIKVALIAGAIIGAVNTLALMNVSPSRPWRNSDDEPGGRPRRWRSTP